MENQTQDEELTTHLLSANQEFRTLAEQHAHLKHEVETLEAKSHLTSDEEFEEQRLKKLKLQTKDMMTKILQQTKHASVG